MNVICIDPITDSVWRRLLESHHSCVFHSPGWMRVLSETYGFEVEAYVLLGDDGEPVSGVPFCRVDDIMGERTVILPFSDYCDPIVTGHDEWDCLVARLLEDSCPVSIRCLHNDLPLSDGRFALTGRAKWHGIDLTPDVDTLWGNLQGAARRAVRKAQKDGVTARIGEDKHDLRAFFEMHLCIRKNKYGLLAQPYSFFENIWHRCIEEQGGLLMLALYRDEIIGGILFMEWDNTLTYKFNVSLPNHLCYRPNDLLVWEGMKYGHEKGYSLLDFGLSDWDQTGLLQFKQKFATLEKTISFLKHAPDGPSSHRADREKRVRHLLPQITDLFVDENVPDYVTEKAGEVLYRFFT